MFLVLFEPVHEVDQFALGGANVSFGCRVHVHEEVQEGEDLTMDVLQLHIPACEVEINVEFYTDEIDDAFYFSLIELLLLTFIFI